MAGAALSHGQVPLRLTLRGRCNTFARRGADFVAGAALSRGQVKTCVRVWWENRNAQKNVALCVNRRLRRAGS